MENMKWRIGDVEVFQIVELEAGELFQSIIKNASPDNIRRMQWLCPWFADESGRLKALVQAFLIRSDGCNILIDPCNGNDKVRTSVPQWGMLQTNFLAQLGLLGVPADRVDCVACTHLHLDHVGWNTKWNGKTWKPTFPHARHFFARQEYEYWVQKPEKEDADHKAAFADSVSPIVEAQLAQMVETNYRIDRHICFVPTPGHTPAHVSVRIESQGERALLSGDFLHHPCQLAEPAWTCNADTKPEDAVRTRMRLLGEIANTGTVLLGSHFSNPVAGQVLRSGDHGFILKS
jgi:glyoxylase-like metal-dependent hydrolase (beta-lactamase superfamily II)